jgi:hypothetical protein
MCAAVSAMTTPTNTQSLFPRTHDRTNDALEHDKIKPSASTAERASSSTTDARGGGGVETVVLDGPDQDWTRVDPVLASQRHRRRLWTVKNLTGEHRLRKVGVCQSQHPRGKKICRSERATYYRTPRRRIFVCRKF